MPLELSECSVEGSGSVSLRYFMTALANSSYEDILVIRYTGDYPFGSAGNGDAQYMYAMATAAIALREPQGVIHDLTELRYEWGDRLEHVFNALPEIAFETPPDSSGTEILYMAAAVGPGCEEAVRTLLLGINSAEPLEKIGWVFRNLTAAWQHVSDVLNKIRG